MSSEKALPAAVIIAILAAWAGSETTTADIAAPGAELKLAGDGFRFTEGPAVDKDGNVYFTDQPNDRIMKWSPDGKITTFMSPSGRSNGLYFGEKGILLACADDKNELWAIDMKGGHAVLVRDFEGKLFNGPNDVWVAPWGGVFFTDAFYKRPYWNRGRMEQGQHVYYLTPDYKTTVRVTDDLAQPNGIIGTPDGKILYIADIGAKKTYAYDLSKDGTLSNKRLFCSMGSDGMTIDEEGNVYLTGKGGVSVFSPAGEKIKQIDVPKHWTANVTFGGKDRRTLFITASDSVYTLQMRVAGR